jgi:hypothetical protein
VCIQVLQELSPSPFLYKLTMKLINVLSQICNKRMFFSVLILKIQSKIYKRSFHIKFMFIVDVQNMGVNIKLQYIIAQ